MEPSSHPVREAAEEEEEQDGRVAEKGAAVGATAEENRVREAERHQPSGSP
jgi:hypothetical protein